MLHLINSRNGLMSLGLALLMGCTTPNTTGPNDSGSNNNGPNNTAPGQQSAAQASRGLAQIDLPPMKTFGSLPRARSLRSNRELARDFIDLSFQLESGTSLDQFTRFEGNISLRVTGNTIPASLNPDLSKLLSRLRTEAGIAITRVAPNSAANITIEMVPRDELRRRAPNTACIVAPEVSTWTDFKRARRGSASWTSITTRRTLAIFIPDDEAPQEIRDCLHEELAQALGPLNDLFRLPDSVFNDDNIHSVLTEFDMLMLRATYAPELRSGMRRSQVASQLPSILRRINPAGENVSSNPAKATPRKWIEDVVIATGSQSSTSARLKAAERAALRARSEGWEDNRTGFSFFLLGRLAASKDLTYANTALTQAYDIFRARENTQYHAAQTALPLATIALVRHDYNTVLSFTESALPAARASGNAVLLTSLLQTQAHALAAMGRFEAARSVYLDSLGWARYGFGSSEQVRMRAEEIAALASR